MPDDTQIDLRQTVAALRQQLEARTAERDEALAQQNATNEILRAIARSPNDIRPVFDAIVASAAQFCEAEFSAVARFDDGLLHLVAINNMSADETAAFHRLFPRRPNRDFAMGRAFLHARPVQFDDVLTELDYDASTREVLQSVAGYRSALGVPILLDGRPFGVIGCGRREVKPFAAAQIELVETFADQAAIALDNALLLRELQQRTDELAVRNSEFGERIEHQSATIDVLKAMSASLGDPQPVFDLIVRRARDLCNTTQTWLHGFDGELVHLHSLVGAEAYGMPDALEAYKRLFPMLPTRGSIACRAILDRQTIHVRDLATVPGVSAAVRKIILLRENCHFSHVFTEPHTRSMQNAGAAVDQLVWVAARDAAGTSAGAPEVRKKAPVFNARRSSGTKGRSHRAKQPGPPGARYR